MTKQGEGKMTLSAKDVPEVKNWEEGGEYKVEFDIRQVSQTEGEGDDAKADYRIVGAQSMGEKNNNENEENNPESVEDIYS